MIRCSIKHTQHRVYDLLKITKNGNKFQFQLYNSIATSTLVIPWSIVAKEMSIMRTRVVFALVWRVLSVTHHVAVHCTCCRVSRFVTLQRLRMNQKREVSRKTSRPQSTKNACFVDAMSTSFWRRQKLTKTLESSVFRGFFYIFWHFLWNRLKSSCQKWVGVLLIKYVRIRHTSKYLSTYA